MRHKLKSGIEMEIIQHRIDTLKHTHEVIEALQVIAGKIMDRGWHHDASKLREPELSAFAEYGPKLKETTYGSEKYKGYLREIGQAVKHHYQENSHHPEFFEGGITSMNLLDLIEMVCDWKAASERMQKGGSFQESIEINIERFKIEPQLASILRNSVCLFVEGRYGSARRRAAVELTD